MIGNRITRKPVSPSARRGGQKNNKSRLRPMVFGGQAKKQAGFTLVEILVVMAVFAVLGVLLVNIFIMALQSQRQTSSRQKALGAIRYVAENISRQIRTSEINYDYYQANQGIINPQESLALINQQGETYVYQKFQDENGKNYIGAAITKNGYTDYALLTNPREIDVKRFDFYINPISNPFLQERCNQPSDCIRNSCTIDDSIGDKSGFCCCIQDSDCLSKNCDLSEESQNLFNQYCGQNGFGGTCLEINAQPKVTIVLEFESVSLKINERKTINFQTTVSSRVYKR